MRHVFRSSWFLVILAACCMLSNLIAPLINTAAMRANARDGCALLQEEGATPQMIEGYKLSQADNYTAVLILKTAAYTGGESYLKRAFGGLRTDLTAKEGEDAWVAFCNYADGRLSPTGGLSYSRYWHGYMLPIRLLLCFFGLTGIRTVSFLLQAVMFAG